MRITFDADPGADPNHHTDADPDTHPDPSFQLKAPILYLHLVLSSTN